jgi:ProP effector
MYQDHNDVIAKLAKLFPNAIYEDVRMRRPLKANITADIERQGCNDLLGFNVGEAVNYYMNRLGYLKTLEAGATRIDLDGKPAGKVTETEAWDAKIEVDKINKERALKSPQPQSTPTQARKVMIDGTRANQTIPQLLESAQKHLAIAISLEANEYTVDFRRRVCEDARMDLTTVLAKLDGTVTTHTEVQVINLPRD